MRAEKIRAHRAIRVDTIHIKNENSILIEHYVPFNLRVASISGAFLFTKFTNSAGDKAWTQCLKPDIEP